MTHGISLSVPTVLKPKTDNATSFTTNILVVGGAYAGLSAVRSLAYHFNRRIKDPLIKLKLINSRVSITMVEPKSGLLNILGIPRAIVDVDFAKTQYISFEDFYDLKFDKVVSNQPEVLKNLATGQSTGNNEGGFEINFVHGRVTHLDEHRAEYQLVESDETATINFDYVILASGRDRSWPTTPNAYTTKSYLEEMTKSKSEIDSHDIISIIGAGAVGIEIAGDIKHYCPNKTVNLMHPHETFPPEPLSTEFQSLTYKSLVNSGVNVHLNTRILKELENGDLETTTGEIIKSDFNYWCHAHQNNISILSDNLRKEFVTSRNNILVNEYLQLLNKDKKLDAFFCIGDIVELPIIKSAGWAMYMGRLVANNLVSMILDNILIEPFPDLTQMPRGMVIVAGNGEIVSELCGEVELNHKGYVEEYRDYCIGKIRSTIGV
mmetsp:Transcript_3172/g.3555  ORF Transcript_3172/g.3555 Transcript_3172/m.3555 type:complete len:435 (+) Transcript_3172:47-1351(+)